MRLLSLTALLLIIGFEIKAQEFHYSIRNYKAVDGLPQSQVSGLVEDNNGYLWVGTINGGIARFDGRNFKVYTTLDGLLSNIVHDLYLDKKQNLWIIHPTGVTRFDGVRFRKFEQPGSRNNMKMLRKIFEVQDTLFMWNDSGHLGKIHNDSVYYWSRPFMNAKIDGKDPLITRAISINDSTVLYGVNRSVFHLKRGKKDFNLNFTTTFINVYSVFQYQGELYIQTEKGFWSLDEKNETLLNKSLPIDKRILYYDNKNEVFWTTKDRHLYKTKLHGDKSSDELVLNDIAIVSIVVDSEGNTWLGTNGSGLFKYYVQDFDKISPDNVINVMTIHHDNDGAIWVGSMTKGLFKIFKGKTISYEIPDGSEAAVFDIAQSPDGTIFATGSAGIGKYNKIKDVFEWKPYIFEKRKHRIFTIQFDESGGRWLGVASGGINYQNGTETVNYLAKDGLGSNYTNTTLYSVYYKSLFVGNDMGLYKIKDGKVSNIKIKGLENTSVININPYRDSLLVLSTTGAGIFVYNPKTEQAKLLNTRDGLASDFVYFAVPDENDFIWVGSEKGINRIFLDQSLDINGNRHYDFDNGLTGVETNQNAFHFYDSVKLFGLVDGMYQFNDYKFEDAKQFKLHLTRVELFYGETSTAVYSDSTTGFFHIPVNLALPPDKNHITFHFNKVNKRYPKAIKFKYYLDGFDNAWSLPSSTTQATYGNLPPGNYTFKVISSDIYGKWNTEVLSYNFVVNSPFYARTGFIIGAILFLGGLISIILYMRVKSRVRNMLMLERVRVEEQEKVRKDIARDFHDEMGNQLTRIINYISLLQMNGATRAYQEESDLYNKVEQSAKYLYTGTRDFIWSIDPSNDELCKLFLHIRDFGEKIFEEKNINFRATNTVKETIRLPYGFSREANLILKEAMTNAFKYSEAENVTLILKKSNEGFHLSLVDDGIGFDKRKCIEASCRGLKNMEERAEKISAVLEIQSVPAEGTEVSIFFNKPKRKNYGITL
jgi:signal transduction histidine kinase/ligand-binding sensor domain-containing protein